MNYKLLLCHFSFYEVFIGLAKRVSALLKRTAHVVLERKLVLLLMLSLAACDIQAYREHDCRKQAANRIELYNKPDITITEHERNNALYALFNECMRESGYQEHIDAKNARLPENTATYSPVTPVSASSYQLPASLPKNVTATSQPVIQQPSFNPAIPAKKELENILTQQN